MGGLTIEGERVLLCPGCGSENLHHMRVQVFDRDKEDAETGRKVTVERRAVVVTGDAGGPPADGGNPSSRRDGIRINFECEMCPTKSALEILQHKGSTLVGMYAVC